MVKTVTDLTRGSTARVLLKFSLPMMLSVLFQQMYNIADSVIAGKLISEDALAAVGASYPVTMIFMAVAVGCNIGCSVVISRLFGAGDHTGLKTAVSTSFICVLSASLLLTAVGFATGGPLLKLLNTPDNIFSDSLVYLNIYVGGLFFMFLYNLCNGIFTALGDSSTSLYFLIGSSVFNVFADIFAVAVLKLGVAGVAWATLVSQALASGLALAVLLKKLRAIGEKGKYSAFSGFMLGEISRFAVPSILQQSFVSVGNLLVQGIINSYNSSVVAGYSAANKLNTFAIMMFMAMANALSSYCAQNAGAGRLDRIYAGFKSACVIIFCVALPFAVTYFFAGQWLISLFLPDGSELALETGTQFLRVVSPFFLLVIFKLVSDGVLRGSGSAALFAISTLLDLILRVALAFILSPSMGTLGVWVSWPIGWAMGVAVSLGFFFSGKWKRKVPAPPAQGNE